MGWWKESQRIVLMLAVLALVSGCAMLRPEVTPPELRVSDVRVLGMSLADAKIAVDLEVDNPNAYTLSLRRLTYGLSLQDKPLFNGIVSERIQVEANGSSRVTLPFTLRFQDALGTMRALAQSEELRYRLSGEADFGLLSLPYSKSGSIGLPKLPEVSVKSVQVDAFTLSGLALSLGVQVNNANDFPVDFKGMNYELKIADAPLLTGRSTQALAVNPNGTGMLTLDMFVAYGDLGALARKLRDARSLPVEFTSRMIVPGSAGEVVIPYHWKGEVPLLR